MLEAKGDRSWVVATALKAKCRKVLDEGAKGTTGTFGVDEEDFKEVRNTRNIDIAKAITANPNETLAMAPNFLALISICLYSFSSSLLIASLPIE
jgi:hexokinase